MKHIFIIETAGLLTPSKITQLHASVCDLADAKLGDDNVVSCSCNESSAIRAVYRLFSADQSLSPDELGSAK